VELDEFVTPFALATGGCYRRIDLADAFMVTEKVPKMSIDDERCRENHRERVCV